MEDQRSPYFYKGFYLALTREGWSISSLDYLEKKYKKIRTFPNLQDAKGFLDYLEEKVRSNAEEELCAKN